MAISLQMPNVTRHTQWIYYISPIAIHADMWIGVDPSMDAGIWDIYAVTPGNIETGLIIGRTHSAPRHLIRSSRLRHPHDSL